MSKVKNLMDRIKDFFIYNQMFLFNLVGVYRDVRDCLYVRKSFQTIFINPLINEQWKLDWLKLPYTIIELNEEILTIAQTYPKQKEMFILTQISDLLKLMHQYQLDDYVSYYQKNVRVDNKPTNLILVSFAIVLTYISKKSIFFTALLIASLFYFL